MSTHDIDIELPPLPVPRAKTDGGVELFAEYSVREYARAAIKADRQRRGEPVAYRLMHNNGNGVWLSDGRGWCEGRPEPSLVRGVEGDPQQWRIEYAYPAPQPAEPVKVPGDGVRCNWCGWSGIEVDLVIETAADEPEDGPASVCPTCNRIGCLMDLDCGERAAQGLPQYSPRKPTEEEWSRLTENGRKAWGGPVAYAVFADNGNIRIWQHEPLDWPEAVPLYAAPQPAEPVELDRYDAGLLGGQDGMPAYVWHDIIRAELDRAYDFYMDQLYRATPQPADPVVKNSLTVPDGWQLVPKELTQEMFYTCEHIFDHGNSGESPFEFFDRKYKDILEAAPKFGEEE